MRLLAGWLIPGGRKQCGVGDDESRDGSGGQFSGKFAFDDRERRLRGDVFLLRGAIRVCLIGDRLQTVQLVNERTRTPAVIDRDNDELPLRVVVGSERILIVGRDDLATETDK